MNHAKCIIDGIHEKTFSGWIGSSHQIDKISFTINNRKQKIKHTTHSRKDVTGYDFIIGFSLELTNEEFDEITRNKQNIAANFYEAGKNIEFWKPVEVAIKIISLSEYERALIWKFLPEEIRNKMNGAMPIIASSPNKTKHIMVSDCGTAIMSPDGSCFIYGGSNRVAELYTLDEDEAIVQSWKNIIKRRKNQCDLIGVRYLQIFIPEKTSTQWWASPYKASKGSPRFQSIRQALLNEELSDVVYDFFNEHPDDVENIAYFQMSDSHLSSLGARNVTNGICKHLNLKDVFDELKLHFDVVRDKKPDLLTKFHKDISIPSLEYTSVIWRNEILTPTEIDSFNSNRHIGTTRKWRCDAAPYKLKVICFGNSFFERGSHSTGLSWWFSRLFHEFEFIWSPNLCFDYIHKEKPDIVIGQGIERFMFTIPNDDTGVSYEC